MRLELNQTGSYVLEPQRLSVEANELRRRMRLALVNSMVERGVDGDEGRIRLTVRSASRFGAALSTQTTALSAKSPSTSGIHHSGRLARLGNCGSAQLAVPDQSQFTKNPRQQGIAP